MDGNNINNSFQSAEEVLKTSRTKSFGILQIYPKHVSFLSQNPNEVIYILMRSHFMVNLSWIIRAVSLSLVPLILIALVYGISLIDPDISDSIRSAVDTFLPGQALVIVSILYYSFVLTYIYMRFVDWYFDLYLVTNERVLHMDFKVFSGKSIAEAPLGNIEDISQNVAGLFPSMFNYGDVLVQTAAEKSKFLFKSVPDPGWFRDVLSDLSKLEKNVQHNGPTNVDQRLHNLDLTLNRRREYMSSGLNRPVDPYFNQRTNVPVYPNANQQETQYQSQHQQVQRTVQYAETSSQPPMITPPPAQPIPLGTNNRGFVPTTIPKNINGQNQETTQPKAINKFQEP